MVGRRLDLYLRACAVGLLALSARAPMAAQESIPPGRVEEGPGLPGPPATNLVPGLPDPNNQRQVIDVRVEGHESMPLQRIRRFIRTRGGRPLDPEVVEGDVRNLIKSRLFLSVDTSYQPAPGGVIVVFHVVERPTLQYVHYVGNTIAVRHLDKQTELKKGDALDPYAIEEARRKLQEYYISKGFSKATVTLVEGGKTDDRGAVFLINEGQKQKILRVDFVGNTIVRDDRLQTQIESKRPLLFLFKGQVDREKIDADVERLTTYYRSLGFFSARIGRELVFNEKQNWAKLTFVIDEGPRYVVRKVSFIGHSKFSSDELAAGLKLKDNQFFDQAAMTKDVSLLLDKYGSQGYIFADVRPDPRYAEEPGELDLVYQVAEGDRYRVGRIDVLIEGENPHTQRDTVLNRISLRPGDIVDVRQKRASERRLRASGLFMNDPAQGIQPKIVFGKPKVNDEAIYAERPPGSGSFRGQSPDGPRWRQPATGSSGDRWIVLSVQGRLADRGPLVPPQSPAAARPATAPAAAADLQQRPASNRETW
ncbi:MAG: POTRA domain-containing protein [Pirellulales bacterium]